MRKRKLGRTGYEVSEVGADASCLSAASGGDVRDAQRALYMALEAGVTFLHTGPGQDESERLVGEVIRDLRARDRAVVATGVPPLRPAGGRGGIEQVFPREYLVRSVEGSLRSQRAEVLSIAQLGGFRDAWLGTPAWSDLRGVMRELVRAGKVLRWGVSLQAPAVGVLDDPLIETVQVAYNVFERGAEAELFARASEREVGVIVRAPLDHGVLAGEYTRDTVFRPADVRAAYLAGARQAEAVERVDALRALLGDEARTLPELALRFCLSRAEVGAVIVGMRRPEHVREDLAVSDGRALTAELIERLRQHGWQRDWAAPGAA